MPDESETPFEFHAGVTELRGSLGFTVQQVAESGNPCVVSRYGRHQVAIVPLWEWWWLKAIESAKWRVRVSPRPGPVGQTGRIDAQPRRVG